MPLMTIMHDRSNRQSFTLIEILIAISILAALIIISTTLINPQKSVNQTRDATLKNSMVKIAAGIELFKLNKGHYPDPDYAQDITDLGEFLLNFTITGVNDGSIEYAEFENVSGGIHTGEANNDVIFYKLISNPNIEACLQAKSNEYNTEYMFWIPGNEVQLSTSSISECSSDLSNVAAN